MTSMKVYVLSVVTDDYYKYEDCYGVFSSEDKAIEYAKSERPELKIYSIDEITCKDYSYWEINEWLLDKPLDD